MGAFDQLNIAGSGLSMHQTWLDSLSHNIANVNTSKPTDGPAFQAQYVMAAAAPGGGVRVSGTALGDPEGRLVHAPDDPLADADGYVRRPDIDMGSQMGQLVMAQRGFQAQVQVVKNAQETYNSALSIGRSA
ncbi:MAG TPA: flagellar basal body rod C-terminal domain-containing protein [Nocardioidaceae bacterium]|jgi:flagellar basal-body rod protein FlgC|nr:flagellar basal body rod C-terminal domain-containing protein [Nocardioidaceae bacterium]